MNIYHAWGNLRPGVSDIVLGERLAAYMDTVFALYRDFPEPVRRRGQERL